MLDGRKLLVVAALTKNWDMFAWGLQQGVDINDVDNSGMGLLSILLSLGAEEGFFSLSFSFSFSVI